MTPGTAMPSAIEGALSTSEAKRRLDQFGPSAIPEARSMPLWLRVARQFQSPLIYILVFALLFDIGMWLYEGADTWPIEAIAIFAILLLNAGLGRFRNTAPSRRWPG